MGRVVSPQKRYILTPVSSKCDFIWKFSCWKCNQLKWDHSGVGWALNPVWLESLWERRDRQTHTKNSYLMMETEAGVTAFKPRNTRVCLQPLRASRGKKGCSLIGFRGILTLLITWFQTSSLQDWETKHSFGFKPHVLWYFVSTAPGNPYRASQGFLHERKTNDPCKQL